MENCFYGMDASSNVKDYINPGNGLEKFQTYCTMSEFQYLDKNSITVEVDPTSGTICQDFIYNHGIPLVSERFKEFLDEMKVDYLFYKKVILKKSSVGMEEVYWLALPPRINCLNFEESDIDEFTGGADEIVINADKIGRYEIFKIAGVTNLDIVVTEKIANKIRENKFLGIHIYPIN